MSWTPRCSSTWTWPASTSAASSRSACPRRTRPDAHAPVAVPLGGAWPRLLQSRRFQPRRSRRPTELLPRPRATRTRHRLRAPPPWTVSTSGPDSSPTGPSRRGSRTTKTVPARLPRLSTAAGTAVDGAPLSSLGDFGTKAGIDLGLGYVAAPALRLEAMLQHRPRFSFDGRANFLQTTDRQDVSAEAVHRDRHACRLRGPAGPRATAGGALEPVHRRRRRPFPHPYRGDAHGVSTDEDRRSGRPSNRFRVDGHGGGRSVFGGQNDA